MEMYNYCLLFRFIFILDKSCPNFNINKEFYVDQLRKHLIVNIYKDGKWGTIIRKIVDNSNINTRISLDDNTCLSHINSVT